MHIDTAVKRHSTITQNITSKVSVPMRNTYFYTLPRRTEISFAESTVNYWKSRQLPECSCSRKNWTKPIDGPEILFRILPNARKGSVIQPAPISKPQTWLQRIRGKCLTVWKMLKSASSLVSSSLVRQLRCTLSTSCSRLADKPAITQQPSKADVDELFSESADEPAFRRRHAFSLNRVELIGGLSDDPVTRVARTGTPYAAFNVITNREYRNQSGEQMNETERHAVCVFGRAANFVTRVMHKGTRVYLTGRLHYNSIERDDGTRMRIPVVLAEIVQPLARREIRSEDETVHSEPLAEEGKRETKKDVDL
ncbi:hypothetical protein AB6A40_006492 [Gnathostoma spinigerum]|uniref:Single-stranded DNA-binding protein n=1 Tax=Gnathostoma spinigerum TaxID=75299 RepID=A0ABD6ERY9_9BILA